MREYLSRSFPVTSALSLWTVIVSSGSAAARFPFAFFSFPATLFSSSFSFESYASLYRTQPPCLTTEFGATSASDIRCGEDCGLLGVKSILGYGSSRLARMKKKSVGLKYFWKFQIHKKIYIFLRKKENNKKNVQTNKQNKQMKIQTKIKMKCFEYFCNILFLKIICSTFKTQTHSSVLKINCV